MRMRQRRENSSGCAALCLHAAAHHRDERQIRLDLDGIRIRQPVNVRHDLLLLVHEFALMHHNRHRVDSGGHVLNRDAVVLESLQNLAAEADLGIHHVLGDQNRAEILFAGNACDGVAGLLAGALHNPGSVILRLVRVLDVDRNAFMANRENGIFVQNAGTHVRQLAQLLVSDGMNGNRIVHDPRIRHQEPGHIRPVLVDADMAGTCHDGAGDIRSAAGEGFHLSVCAAPVKSRNDRIFQPGKLLFGLFLRPGLIQLTVLVKKDDLRRVHEREAEVLCHDVSVQILAAGSRVITVRLVLQICLNGPELLLQRILQPESLNDFIVAGLNLAERIREILSFRRKIIAAVQKIRHLSVSGKPLSGRRGHHIDSARVRVNNRADLLELLCIRKRTSAELDNLFHFVFFLHSRLSQTEA